MKQHTLSSSSSASPCPAAVAISDTPAPQNAVYNSQAAAIVFSCGIVFKVSSLPGLVYTDMLSDTLWLYLLMCALDVACLAAVFFFAASGADAALVRANSPAYKVLSFLLTAFFLVKGLFYFTYTLIFLLVDLFVEVEPYVVVLVLSIPVLYAGSKGISAVARAAELLAPLLFGLVVANLALLEADLDVGRNLPLAAMPTGDFFSRGLRYGLWLGDCFPLAFAALKRKKFPYLAVGTGVSYTLVVVIAMLSVALYGGALPYAYNMLIRIAGFNRLSLEIGRLEWAALFVVAVMAVLGLALTMWGAGEGSRRWAGSPLPGRIAFAACTVVTALAVPNAQDIIDFSMTDFGYAMFAAALAFAAAFLCFALYARKKLAPAPDDKNPQNGNGETGDCTQEKNCKETQGENRGTGVRKTTPKRRSHREKDLATQRQDFSGEVARHPDCRRRARLFRAGGGQQIPHPIRPGHRAGTGKDGGAIRGVHAFRGGVGRERRRGDAHLRRLHRKRRDSVGGTRHNRAENGAFGVAFAL